MSRTRTLQIRPANPCVECFLWEKSASPGTLKSHCDDETTSQGIVRPWRSSALLLRGSQAFTVGAQQPGHSVAGAIHGLQLPASQKDHAWSQTALTSDPVPDLRWVHRIERPGCFRVRNGTSVGSEIPRCVKSEVGVWSYTDFVVRDRGEDNCTGRGAKAIDDYCLA
jgi:hypothetical protein